MSAPQTQDQSLAPNRGRTARALLAITAALLVAFDVACLSILGFLIIGQTLGYLSLLGWTHAMVIVGVVNAVLFFLVLSVLLSRWRRGHRRGHLGEIALITTIAAGSALLLGQLYSENGRPSIPPEQLLRALLLQAFYTIRSERQLMEQLNYNLLFRWFVGLSVDDPVWVPTVFSKNRDRLLEGDIAAAFMSAVLNLPRVQALVSDEHFSVDGTLIKAWASMKSFRRKDGNDEPPAPGRNGERNFRGEKRSNQTHASTTDADARLARKSGGQESKMGFTGHLLMENRNGLIVDARLTLATGTAEPEAALDMLGELPTAGNKTVGADKNYDTAAFVAAARELGVTPHVAQNITAHRGSNIDGRTTRHDGYRASQVIRKRIEEANGWIKEVGGMAQTKFRGLPRVGWMFTLKATAYNLVRMPRLLAIG